MDTSVLVERDIEEGQRLLEALDQAGVEVVGAMWFRVPEEGVWRYYVATPLVEQKGPRHAYARIEAVRAGASPPVKIPLESIVVLGPNEPPIGELRIYLGVPKGPHVSGFSLTKTAIGDLYVDDAFIYRMERIIGITGSFEMWFAVRPSGKHKWEKRSGKITTKDGFTVKVEVDGWQLRQSVSRHGLNAVFYVLQNIVTKDGKEFGDVERWRVLDGRLRTVERVATGVEISS